MNEFLSNSKIRNFYILNFVIWSPILALFIAVLNFINTPTTALLKEFISRAGFHIFIAIWIYYNLITYKINIKELIGKTRPVTQYIKYIWLIPFVFLFAMNLQIFTIYVISKNQVIFEKFISLNKPINNYSYFVLSLFIAPCLEEIFFRRIMLQRFIMKWGTTKALLYSSLIFMLGHMERVGFDAFIFSIVVSIIFLKTRIISCCIFFHAVANFIGISIIADKYEIFLSNVAGININTFADIPRLVTSSKNVAY